MVTYTQVLCHHVVHTAKRTLKLEGERERERERVKLGHMQLGTCRNLIFTSTTKLSPGSFIKMRSHQDGHLK